MFRKFMIVCWVLFGLFVMGAAINGYSYIQYGNQVLDLRNQNMIDKGIIDPDKIRNAFYSIATEYELTLSWRKKVASASDVLDEIAAAESKPVYADLYTGLSDTELSLAELEAREAASAAQQLFSRRWDAEILIYMASLNAAMILVWNVLWHTGHWVWKRRKVKDNIHQRQLAKVLRKQKDQLEEL